MTKSTTTEKELTDALCYDFSIQTLPQGKDFLILMCKNKEGSTKLMDILSNNAFDLKIFVDEKTGNYSLDFHFIKLEIGFRFDTRKNETTYPPLQKLKNSQIRFITTGVWTGRSELGRTCEYDPKLMRLGLFDIGDSFKQANGVQFIHGELGKEPSAVILTYKDYDHIFAAEADEAYNRLTTFAQNRPLLEITPVDSETVNLRIWDILVDLDIKFEGLKYSDNQLNQFLEKTAENHSFALAIGFLPSGSEKAAIASTKREGFELVTLYGYTYKNKET
jgi:hypothetical protein